MRETNFKKIINEKLIENLKKNANFDRNKRFLPNVHW